MTRQRCIGHWLDSALLDCRIALRMLRKSLGFTAVAILTLAVGIGASTSVFSVVNAVLIRALSYPHPDRLVYVWSPNPRFQLPIEYLTPMNADFFELRKQNRSFASLALFSVGKFNVSADGRSDVAHQFGNCADRLRTKGVSKAYFCLSSAGEPRKEGRQLHPPTLA